MTLYETSSIFWMMVTAVATAVMAAIVGVAAILTLRQIREASRARQLDAALAILRYIDSPDYRKARTFIYTQRHRLAHKLSEKPRLDELDQFLQETSGGEVDLQCIRSYLTALEHISILVMNDLAPDSIIDMYFGSLILNPHNTLQPLITYLRHFYQSDNFLQHYDLLRRLIEKEGLRVPKVRRWRWWMWIRNRSAIRRGTRLRRQLLYERRLRRKTRKEARQA